jgi:hypothetical protein
MIDTSFVLSEDNVPHSIHWWITMNTQFQTRQTIIVLVIYPLDIHYTYTYMYIYIHYTYIHIYYMYDT